MREADRAARRDGNAIVIDRKINGLPLQRTIPGNFLASRCQ
jgi:hypothetical protein